MVAAVSALKIEATVEQDGMLTLRNVPFRAGERVEVIVLGKAPVPEEKKFPLRGKPYKFDDPYSPVGVQDWDALK